MSRVFAYCRVSTTDQNTSNQVQDIRAAGYEVDKRRVVEESISGSVSVKDRPSFQKLLERIEEGDVLIVTKLDRLGRNMLDVCATVKLLDTMGVRVVCLQLGGADLTSPSARMTMQILSSVAEFERSLLIERTQSGLARAKAEGKTLGRKPKLDVRQQIEVRARLAEGATVYQVAKDFGVARQVIMRVRDKVAA
jgi:putative DNA-invertase from lambdoid prophage Rac